MWLCPEARGVRLVGFCPELNRWGLSWGVFHILGTYLVLCSLCQFCVCMNKISCNIRILVVIEEIFHYKLYLLLLSLFQWYIIENFIVLILANCRLNCFCIYSLDALF